MVFDLLLPGPSRTPQAYGTGVEWISSEGVGVGAGVMVCG